MDNYRVWHQYESSYGALNLQYSSQWMSIVDSGIFCPYCVPSYAWNKIISHIIVIKNILIIIVFISWFDEKIISLRFEIGHGSPCPFLGYAQLHDKIFLVRGTKRKGFWEIDQQLNKIWKKISPTFSVELSLVNNKYFSKNWGYEAMKKK